MRWTNDIIREARLKLHSYMNKVEAMSDNELRVEYGTGVLPAELTEKMRTQIRMQLIHFKVNEIFGVL